MPFDISVIIPVYNCAPYLKDALDSILSQSLVGLECIIINDGSTDGSSDILTSYREKNSSLIVINQENHGYGAACNAGIKKASGKYIAIFEPDDILGTDFYLKLYDAAKKTNVDIVKYSGFNSFHDRNKWQTQITPNNETEHVHNPESVFSIWISHASIWNAIYKRTMLLEKQVFFPETVGASFQDAQFHVSLFYAAKTIYIVKGYEYNYRQHPSQSVNNADHKINAVIENWNFESLWITSNNIKNVDYFLYNTFSQFHTLFAMRLTSKKNKQILYIAMKQLAKNLGQKHLRYPGAPFELQILYRLLAHYPIASPLFRSITTLSAKRHKLKLKVNNALKKVFYY